MIDFYGGSETGDSLATGHIDLREEVGKIIWDEGRGIYLLYRKIQFENSIPKKCPCWSGQTQEQDIDTQCRVCRGLGYFFNDYIIRGYRSQSQGYSTTRRHQDQGVDQKEYRTYYLEHSCISSLTGNNFDIPTTYDRIIELESDINAIIVSPLRPIVKYGIISVDPYRLENGGRIEYYRIRTKASLEGSYLI